MIDNTFASPVNQQPIALGVDLVDAQRDEVPERAQRCHRWRARRLGGTARTGAEGAPAARFDPGSARGLRTWPWLKTLGVRMDRHNNNAMKVATWLASDKRVEAVYYPDFRTILITRSRASR